VAAAAPEAGRPRFVAVLLRIEGLLLFAAAIALYVDGGFSGLAFALLILAPDLSMIGYAAGPRVGAIAYDVAHFEALPLALGALGVVVDSSVAVQLALIWLAHIGIDRALGYGLKYESGFKDTHLQRV
jgi:hypothetical protein